MINECKRCLLLESGNKKSFETVQAYIENLDTNDKVTDKEYERRLDLCRGCDSLISGMCLKCGCYVEIRAILKSKKCADYDFRKW